MRAKHNLKLPRLVLAAASVKQVGVETTVVFFKPQQV